ncbi:MAG: ABC transporter permease [Deferrisomatales bacterium]
MTLKDIAFLNLRRRKAKAAFVLAGLVTGVATVVALIALVQTMTHDINHKLEKFGANILIVPKTENLSLTYGGLSLGGVSFEMKELRQQDLDKVQTIRNAGNVAALGPVVLGVVDAAGRQVLLAGIDFQAAAILKPWWKIDGAAPSAEEAVLGGEAARVLGVGPGDVLELKGRNLKVSGVLEPTGSQDDQLVFTRLETAQALLGKEGRISMAEVAALCKDCPIQAMVAQIGEVLPGAKVMAIQQVVKGRMEALEHFRRFSYGVSAVVILVGGLVVLVTMMGSVRERTGEIGIFRAIGFRKSHVVRVVLIEAAVVSVVAGAVGYLAGLGATRLALPFFTESRSVSIPVDPWLAAGALFLAVFVGMAASSYPAVLAARMDPNEALRAL